MRRRGKSPWLEAEKKRVRAAAPMGVAHRIACGETPFQAWRVEDTMTLRKLARLTGIPSDRLLLFEGGAALPDEDELAALAVALRVTPDLLRAPTAESASLVGPNRPSDRLRSDVGMRHCRHRLTGDKP